MSARSRKNDGFTLIEVMMAIGIMTVGAVGIMALQQASTRGNMEARQISTASELTRTWIERIRRDALRFNQRGLAGVDTETTWLRSPAVNLGVAQWAWPADNPPEYAAADWYGRDVRPGNADAVYCTNLRTSWIDDATIRVDVRTWWHRRGRGVDAAESNQTMFANCTGDAAAVTAVIDQHTILRSVQASTIVRQLPLQN